MRSSDGHVEGVLPPFTTATSSLTSTNASILCINRPLYLRQATDKASWVSTPSLKEPKLISAGLLTIIRKNKAKSKEMRVLFLYVHSSTFTPLLPSPS